MQPAEGSPSWALFLCVIFSPPYMEIQRKEDLKMEMFIAMCTSMLAYAGYVFVRDMIYIVMCAL